MAQAARWHEVEALFDAAQPLDSAARAALLDQRCGSNTSLRAEVESLLSAAASSGDFLEADSRACTTEAAQATLGAGALVGDWAVVELIGRGGMSEVYLAERADGQYTQRAALKLLSPQLARKAHLLQEERQLLARLEHPGITRLIDGGVHADGRPYLVMEYVAGLTLMRWCREHRAALAQRLEVFAQVCEAVAYAHRHLVVHRDLKPANILVTADGSVRLLDFGIAQMLGPAVLADAAGRTLHLTPAYAAPEQLSGGAVTTATDVYSLGVLLYELLCGEPPLQLERLPMTLALERVLNQEPEPPSAAARRASAPPVPPAQLAGDLDHIVAKALRKLPEQRYASAAELKTDLERFLRHEPVSARGYDMRYVIGRFVRRHRTAVGLALAAVTALVAGLSVALWFYVDAQQARKRAEASAATTQAINDFLNHDLLAGIQLESRPTREVTLSELLDDAARQTDRRFAGQPEAAARVHQSIGESYFNLSQFETARVQFERALALYEQTQGRASDAALAVIARLATLHGIIGPPARAIALFREAIDGNAALHGAGDARIVPLRVEAADALFGTGDFVGAAAQMKELVDGQAARALSEADHYDAMARYAGNLFWLGDYAGAERWDRQALAGRIKLFGPQHMATAITHSFLGGVLTERGRLAEAQAELEPGLVSVKRWVGPDDVFLAVAECALARLRMDQGRLTEAEALMTDAIRIRVAAFGEGSSFVLWTRHQLAEVFQHQGRLREAAELMRVGLPQSEKLDGIANPWTVKQHLVEVSIMRELGDIAGARASLARIPAGALSDLPQAHPIRGQWRYEEGLLELQAGERERARASFTAALEIYRACYGKAHPRTRAVETQLAVLP